MLRLPARYAAGYLFEVGCGDGLRCRQRLASRSRRADEILPTFRALQLPQDRKKTQADERCCLKPAGGELRVARRHDFVKIRNALVELLADATNEKVAKGREAVEQNDGAVLDLAVSLE